MVSYVKLGGIKARYDAKDDIQSIRLKNVARWHLARAKKAKRPEDKSRHLDKWAEVSMKVALS